MYIYIYMYTFFFPLFLHPFTLFLQWMFVTIKQDFTGRCSSCCKKKFVLN